MKRRTARHLPRETATTEHHTGTAPLRAGVVAAGLCPRKCGPPYVRSGSTDWRIFRGRLSTATFSTRQASVGSLVEIRLTPAR